MIDPHGGCTGKVGTAGGLALARGPGLERAWMVRNVLHEIAAPAGSQVRTPTGDPPNLMLWGTEDEEEGK